MTGQENLAELKDENTKGRRSLRNACPRENAARVRLLALEAPLVVDHEPGLFLRDRGPDQPHHGGPRTAVLDHPEHLAIRPVLVELRIREVPRGRIQDRTGRAIALTACAMAIEARPLTLVDRLPFGDVLRCLRYRVLHLLGCGALITRYARDRRICLLGKRHRGHTRSN